MHILEAAWCTEPAQSTLHMNSRMGQGYGGLHMLGNTLFPTAEYKPNLQEQASRICQIACRAVQARAGAAEQASQADCMVSRSCSQCEAGLTLPAFWRLELAARWLSSSSSSRMAACTSVVVWQPVRQSCVTKPPVICACDSVLVHICHSQNRITSLFRPWQHVLGPPSGCQVTISVCC